MDYLFCLSFFRPRTQPPPLQAVRATIGPVSSSHGLKQQKRDTKNTLCVVLKKIGKTQQKKQQNSHIIRANKIRTKHPHPPPHTSCPPYPPHTHTKHSLSLPDSTSIYSLLERGKKTTNHYTIILIYKTKTTFAAPPPTPHLLPAPKRHFITTDVFPCAR